MKTNETINNQYFTRKERLKKLMHLLESITVYNWYVGRVTLLFAYGNDCVIDEAKDRSKVRRMLKKNGYIAHFNGGKLSIEL